MTENWVIARAEVGDLVRLARYLALFVRRGELILLEGDLGTGKTTFARAFISVLTGLDESEISSPTFPLVQCYEGRGAAVHHYDFYRLDDPDDVLQLGLDEALEQAIAIVEWPERAADYLPSERLEIKLSDSDHEQARAITIVRSERWAERIDRLAQMLSFIVRSEWRDAQPRYLQGDASSRSYTRLSRDATNAILMDSPHQPDGPPISDGLPYSRIAHLAETVRPFVAVADTLRKLGLSTPEVYDCDLDAGFLLLEDFGDTLFSIALAEGRDMTELYGRAADILAHLANHPPRAELPLPDGTTHHLPHYDFRALFAEVSLLIDWYLPAMRGAPTPPELSEAFTESWRPLLDRVADTHSWVLRDFHSPNLMILDNRTGLQSIGILDFQDAVRGHAAYDLVSLAQDARLDVPADVEEKIVARYCGQRRAGDAGFNQQSFESAYAILGAQRNTKILGIFARLAIRDGKLTYLQHMPRIRRYLARNLAHPTLAPLRTWYDRHLPASPSPASTIGSS